jgi:integration host factor subunit beta
VGIETFSRKECHMNKSELIEALAQDIGIPHREAAAITNTVIDTMTEALARGESIEIRGFGSFVIKQYGSYEGRNPKTGRKIKVSPKKLPFFKVGKDLREQVNRYRS